eukprot:775142_1
MYDSFLARAGETNRILSDVKADVENGTSQFDATLDKVSDWRSETLFSFFCPSDITCLETFLIGTRFDTAAPLDQKYLNLSIDAFEMFTTDYAHGLQEDN